VIEKGLAIRKYVTVIEQLCTPLSLKRHPERRRALLRVAVEGPRRFPLTTTL
jgi:hypothetical protein